MLVVLLADVGNGGIYWLGLERRPARPAAGARSSTRAWSPTHSFPSGHVGTAVAVYGTAAVLLALWLRIPRTSSGARAGSLVVLLAAVPLFVAVSRLYQGAHHLTDVGTSLVYGSLWLAVLAARLRPRRRAGRAGRDTIGTVDPRHASTAPVTARSSST